MKALIIENETYLAQSISFKLNNLGYVCTIIPAIDYNLKGYDFDLILLASNACDDNYLDFIAKNKQSIIIMLVSFINDNTIIKPIKSGACDYILKPFIIDELIRKIEHYKFHRKILKQFAFYENIISNMQESLDNNSSFVLKGNFGDFSKGLGFDMPFVIKSNFQIIANVFAIKYAFVNNLTFETLKISDDNFRFTIRKVLSQKDACFYITHAKSLSSNNANRMLSDLASEKVIISFAQEADVAFDRVLQINDNRDLISEILSLKDYEKTIILRFKDSYSNIDLAKKLGISRKSLWEKKKKYEQEQ